MHEKLLDIHRIKWYIDYTELLDRTKKRAICQEKPFGKHIFIAFSKGNA